MSSSKTSVRFVLAVFLLLLTEPVPSRATLANSGASACFEEERRALLEFNRSLNAPGLPSWTGEDCCNWERVGCSNRTGHVVKLDFSYVCNYSPACSGGVLSPSLANLTHLNYLDLSGSNVFKVPIPSFIGSLKKLRYLAFSNSYVGLVPSYLGNLSNLLHLDLSSFDSDAWVSDLQWLSGLPSLQYLGLRGVNLTHATDRWVYSINMLPSLLELDLSFCHLTGFLPHSLPLINLTSLLVIDLSFNKFQSSLPPWLFNISTLLRADFSNSDLSGSVPEISLLKNMETLQLQQNSLSGPIPTSIGNLVHLQSLDFSKNKISGPLPASLGNCVHLETLDISSNKLSGPLPASLGNLVHLTTLDLSSNIISGLLPASLGNLVHLETLDLSGNIISNPLPRSIGNLSHLNALDLSFNMINGSIPESIGQLSELTSLNLWSNPWHGIISETHFKNLTRLSVLRISSKSLAFNFSQGWVPSFSASSITISDCQFVSPAFPAWLRNQSIIQITLSNVGISDAIPEWFWRNSSHMDSLDFSHNQLRGQLPNLVHLVSDVNLENNYLEGSIPLWPDVISLNLGSNRFSGPIPLNIDQKMSSLASLDLSRNDLNGSIPGSLTKLEGLVSIDLSRNSLSGSIPKDRNYSESMITMDFSDNNLSGQIPSSLCSKMPLLSWLRLSNNNLFGEFGPALRNCSFLQTLDLGGNKFSGAIPQWIGEDPSYLQILVLRENKFTGSIPQQVCTLSYLHVLDLSHNNLSGSVPTCLGNLRQFTYLGWPLPLLFPYAGDSPWHVDLDPKGVEYEYTSNLPFLNTIDLSSNNLSGEVPKELRNLSNMGSLNLSRNLLTGKIPDDIGNLQLLQTLDLSSNHLQGPIPMSMINMTSLSILNLSYNDLSGPIPSANQFQTFNDPTLFEGNTGLCGAPLPTQCSPSPNDNPEVKEDVSGDEENSGKIWLYVSTTLGFILGFWGVFGSLVLKRSWRHAYFKFADDTKDRLILMIMMKYMACIKRMNKQEGQA